MAECSFSRCVQERRIIKKELQRWTKNMVFVVGLERVAEELMGRRKWKQCQHIVSCRAEALIETSPDETKDWRPQLKCCLCNQGTCLDRAPSPGSDLESTSNDSIYRESSPLARLPSTPSPHSASPHTPTMTTFESVKLAAIAALSRSPDAAPAAPANMFYPPPHGGLFTPWYLPPHMAGPAAHRMEAAPVALKEAAPHGPEMPLDLSAKAVDLMPSMSTAIPQSLRVPMLDNKQIYKAKPRMSAVAGRRTYTEEELQAALRDIQSGKLGTRRAAVIYGIPRSTLRNKVYKLAMERERDAQLQLSAPQLPGGDKEQLSGAEEEREVEKALRKPLLSMEDLVRFSMLEANGLANSEAIRSLLLQSKQGDVWGGLEHSALGPYISQLLAAGKGKEEGFAPPVLPELVRRMMAEERFLVDGQMKRANGAAADDRGGRSSSAAAAMVHSKDDETSDMEATSASCILRIPSFKPTAKNGTGSVASEPFPSPSQESSSQPFNGDSRSPPALMGKGIGVSLRDVIAKSISQKFQQGGGGGGSEMGPMPLSQKLLMSPDMESPFKRGRYSPPLNHMSPHSVIKHNNNNNHHMDDRNVQKMSPTGKSPSMMHQSSSGSGGKGTRPKRGKYRNYDRDSLVEAVRAVQRGEMSVHRAGSYYGVPHSTLEYKVKERHLMRPRKRDPKPPLDDHKRLMSSPQDKPGPGPPKMLTSPAQNQHPPNGLKIPPMFDPAMSPLAYSTPPPFPFWPPNPFHSLPMPDFPRPNAHEQFLASQMMQRLQEVSAHSAPVVDPPLRKIAESLYDGTGTNGNFLDGIIRSSLELGLPAAASKEGDKTLLDQLCRNSRLAPLPVHGGSSSEEDFSPSSEEGSVRQRDNTHNLDEEDYYVKSENDSPSKDSNDESSDNDDAMDDESACDNKDSLQKPVVEVAAKEEGDEERQVEETKEDVKTEVIKSEIDS